MKINRIILCYSLHIIMFLTMGGEVLAADNYKEEDVYYQIYNKQVLYKNGELFYGLADDEIELVESSALLLVIECKNPRKTGCDMYRAFYTRYASNPEFQPYTKENMGDEIQDFLKGISETVQEQNNKQPDKEKYSVDVWGYDTRNRDLLTSWGDRLVIHYLSGFEHLGG